MKPITDRFFSYVKMDTQSDETSASSPSTEKQLNLARILVEELKNMGLRKVSLDSHGYVMASIPANTEKTLPVIGFIAHMDTSPDMSGMNVSPKIIHNYDGGEILLNREKRIFLSPADFPELKNYAGQSLITTDGNYSSWRRRQGRYYGDHVCCRIPYGTPGDQTRSHQYRLYTR